MIFSQRFSTLVCTALPLTFLFTALSTDSLHAQGRGGQDRMAEMMERMKNERVKAEASWRNASFHVAYGDVAVGSHGLAELPVGRSWRMGKNYASSMATNVPLLQGDDVIPPGSYRVQLHHHKDGSLCLRVEGAATPVSKERGDFIIPGKLLKIAGEDATEKLQLSFAESKTISTAAPSKPSKQSKKNKRSKQSMKNKRSKKPTASDLPVFETALQVRFGEAGVDVGLTAVDAVDQQMPGHVLRVFQFPAKMLEQRIDKKLQTPIASLQVEGEKTIYNLIIANDVAKLVPQMAAPATSVGFGPIVYPAKDQVRVGKIVWSKNSKSAATLTFGKVKKDGKSFAFKVGTRRAVVTFS